jgi:hypothetical protein
MQIDFLVLDGSPEALDENVVSPCALAVHADRDAVVDQHTGEFGASELAALIGVEDLRTAVSCDGFLDSIGEAALLASLKSLQRTRRGWSGGKGDPFAPERRFAAPR